MLRFAIERDRLMTAFTRGRPVAGVAQRVFVHSPADLRHDTVDDLQQVTLSRNVTSVFSELSRCSM
jgi:hypothetical protein